MAVAGYVYHNKYLTKNKEEECHTLLINSKYLTQTDFFFFFEKQTIGEK